MEGMWLMLQQYRARDYVLAMGMNHTIREFAQVVFKELDIEIKWQGTVGNEIGVDTKTGKKIIGIDEKYFRPTEVEQLLGDAKKAKEDLGWQPKTGFQKLVKIMVHADWEKVKKRGY
jgi:GDPmannose 4,6-dehydratase